MAIFMPTNVLPDVRSGLGLGVVDAGADMTVSWHINGPSALTKYEIQIYQNDADSTLMLDTGELTTGCPAYGTTVDGEIQFFSATITAAALSTAGITNGNEYKLVITQWWSAADSIRQSSASVFYTRATPTLSITAIGTVTTRYYTFTGTYSQAQGDVLNWLRWQIADADNTDEPFYDSGRISGTMQLSCTYDGFFAGTDYAVRLSCQTENGVEADTGWVTFSVNYTVSDISGEVEAGCVGGTDAVVVDWGSLGYIPGTAIGDWNISDDNIMTLSAGASVTWDYVSASAMNFAAPWSIVWKGDLANANADLFVIGQSGGDIKLTYAYATGTLTLKQGSTTLVSQSGIISNPTVTAVLTATRLYIRSEYVAGGLLPATTLYPATTRYPADADVLTVDTYTLSPSYTQTAITSVSVGGYQQCDYIEVINGTASASVITAAITNGEYEPGLASNDYMLADWTQGLYAGTLNLNGDTIAGFTVYRRQGDGTNLVKVSETGAGTSRVYDYGALSQQGPYTYYLFLTGTSTYFASPIASGTVMPCWWNWTLMECEETDNENIYTVMNAYRFRLNIESGAMTNNNTPSLLDNFTPYPKIQITPQNYKSGSLTGLIGAVTMVNGQPEYMDSIALRDAIFALSVSRKPMFLKNRKGDLIRVRPAGAISMQTGDETRQQTQTMTFPWAEVGPATNVSLYSTAFAGVQEPEGTFTPQYYADTSDATADAKNLRIEKTGYGANGKLVGTTNVTISGNTLVLPEGMKE